MATHRVDFNGELERIFMTNYRRGPEYNVTIQNNTDQILTVEVTNYLLNQDETAVWTDPAGGAATIAIGAMYLLRDPHVAIRLSNVAATTGLVRVTEAG